MRKKLERQWLRFFFGKEGRKAVNLLCFGTFILALFGLAWGTYGSATMSQSNPLAATFLINFGWLLLLTAFGILAALLGIILIGMFWLCRPEMSRW